MPTTNPRITFTVSEDTMKAIDEYRFEHRMRNQTQAILSLIDLGFKALTGENFPQEQQISDEDISLLNLYHNTDPLFQNVAVKIMMDNQRQKERRA
jgi:hypothetical protein